MLPEFSGTSPSTLKYTDIRSWFSRNRHKVWLSLLLLTLIPHIVRFGKTETQKNITNEQYDVRLNRLDNLEKLMAYADESYAQSSGGRQITDTSGFVMHLNHIFKDRFYHGELNYSFSENWIAWLCSKVIWSHFSSIVLIDDILKHPQALCNQQTMVFMEALKKKGIPVRSVGLGYTLPGHFLCEVYYTGAWHLFDLSVEPDWEKIPDQHMSLDYYLSRKDHLYRIYEDRLPPELFYKIMEQHVYGAVNGSPAPNMRLFQRTAKALTYLFPLVFGLLFLISLRRRKTEPVRPAYSQTPASDDGLYNDQALQEKINY